MTRKDSHTQTDTDRGQAFTLEALFASLLLLSAVLFALQTTAITPLTGSTASQQVQNQQAAIAEGVLTSAYEQETVKEVDGEEYQYSNLKEAVLYYDIGADETEPSLHGKDARWKRYSSPTETLEIYPDHQLAAQLDESFSQWGVASNFNIHHFESPEGDDGWGDLSTSTTPIIDMGAPSANAVTATRTIVLYEDDVPLDEDGDPYTDEDGNPITLGDVDDHPDWDFYADNMNDLDNPEDYPIAADSGVYNVVTVEVVVWRI